MVANTAVLPFWIKIMQLEREMQCRRIMERIHSLSQGYPGLHPPSVQLPPNLLTTRRGGEGDRNAEKGYRKPILKKPFISSLLSVTESHIIVFFH